MRDYNLIKYIAKYLGAKPKRSKKRLDCIFPYDEKALIFTYIHFRHGKAQSVLFDLSDVYNEYAKTKYASYEKFIEDFLAKSEVFDKQVIGEDIYIFSDLSVNRMDNIASQALMNVSVVTMFLNTLLNREALALTENDWRSLHRKYLNKSKLLNEAMGAGCFAATIGAIVLSLTMTEFWLFLFFPALIGSVIFLFKFIFYKSQLKKANRNKHYT